MRVIQKDREDYFHIRVNPEERQRLLVAQFISTRGGILPESMITIRTEIPSTPEDITQIPYQLTREQLTQLREVGRFARILSNEDLDITVDPERVGGTVSGSRVTRTGAWVIPREQVIAASGQEQAGMVEHYLPEKGLFVVFED